MTTAGDRYAEAGFPYGCDFAAGEEHEVMKAWEDYLSGLAVEPKIRYVIAKSWQRCAAIGIDPTSSGSKIIVENHEFERRFKRNQTLLRAASDVLDEAQQLLCGTGCMLVVTDLDGVILRTVGDPQTIDAGHEINLIVGADWSEANAGTNGIGTSLAARGPVLVHGPEHFCSTTKLWTCVGSPVRNPIDGELLGLIDVSGRKNTFQQHNLAFAVMVARRIESILKAEFDTERRTLMDYILAMRLSSSADGVIVVDRMGKVLSSNEQAPRLLALRAKGNAVANACLNPENSLLRRREDGKNFDLSEEAANFGIQSDEVLPVHHKGSLIGAVVIAPASRPKSASLNKASNAFSPIVTGCAVVFDAIHRAKRLAAYQAPLLIQGETGVGKELFARAVHDASACAEGPFVTFNCGAVSRDLIASELFGYIKGAFTGAASTGNIGRFERAHNGTLCLDEIGELPLDLQPFLLRVLEEGAVYRVGDATPRPIKVRLIAMTNRDLTKEVEQGRFRRDLLYRLNVATLQIPALRQRSGDVVLLAHHFLDALSKKHNLGLRRFAPDVLDLFKIYPWPGNIRELRNAVESALLLCDSPIIGRGWLPEAILEYRPERAEPAPPILKPATQTLEPCKGAPQPGHQTVPQGGHRESDLRNMDRDHIETVLERFQYNISLAAAALGIARSTLYRRMHSYGLTGKQAGD